MILKNASSSLFYSGGESGFEGKMGCVEMCGFVLAGKGAPALAGLPPPRYATSVRHRSPLSESVTTYGMYSRAAVILEGLVFLVGHLAFR